MKKKILFLLLLLIPFMVNALELKDYSLKWKIEDENYYNRTYNMENTFILATKDELVSIDKLTGERKEVTLGVDDGRIVLLNNHLLVLTFSDNSGSNKLYAFDEYLNRTTKQSINNFYCDYFMKYNDDYAILSGSEYNSTDDRYYYVVKFIDKEGNIVKEDKLKTDDYIWMYYDTAYDRLLLQDAYNNLYIINDNYKIEPLYKNSDGSYMYLNNEHLYKMSSTGEELDSLEIPNGNGTRIAMKDGKYYLATGVYEITSDNKTSVGLNLYIVDENLNISKTGSIEAPDKLMYYAPTDQPFGSDVHGIYYDGENIVAYLRIWTQNSSSYRYDYAYKLNENLVPTATEYIQPYQEWGYSDYGKGLILNNYYEMYDIAEYYNTYNIIREKYENDPYYNGIKYQKDGNNYIVAEYFSKCEGEGCNNANGDVTEFSKADLVYLDSNYNEVFRKTMIDWYTTYEYSNQSIKYNKYPSIMAMPYNDYLIVVATSSDTNIIHVYDRQGNLIKDFSEEASKYPELSVDDIYVTSKGFYVSFDYYGKKSLSKSYRLGALTQLITIQEVGDSTFMKGTLGNKNTQAEMAQLWSPLSPYGYDGPENGIYSVILYFSGNFEVKKEVSGKGSVTATPDKADEGEIVHVSAEPAPGFTLSTIKVTDAQGNVLSVTNNTFVMPASDVTIEAIFVAKNPNTGDIAILTICLFAIASGIILILQKKKLDFLK